MRIFFPRDKVKICLNAPKDLKLKTVSFLLILSYNLVSILCESSRRACVKREIQPRAMILYGELFKRKVVRYLLQENDIDIRNQGRIDRRCIPGVYSLI